MQPLRINDQLAIAGQPDPAEFATLAEQGYRSIINNRPDGEDPTQPGSAAEAAAARAAGLAYTHIPVGGRPLVEDDIRKFQAAVNESASFGGPVLVHCKSGMRSLMLFALSEVLDGRMRREDIVPFGRAHGFDLRAAEAWLAQNQQ